MTKKKVTTPEPKGQAEEIAFALRLVVRGADIYVRPLAGLLRELEKIGLVDICQAMQAPADGAKMQPYFGCIITKLGRKVLIREKMRRAERNAQKAKG